MSNYVFLPSSVSRACVGTCPSKSCSLCSFCKVHSFPAPGTDEENVQTTIRLTWQLILVKLSFGRNYNDSGQGVLSRTQTRCVMKCDNVWDSNLRKTNHGKTETIGFVSGVRMRLPSKRLNQIGNDRWQITSNARCSPTNSDSIYKLFLTLLAVGD